MNEPARRARTAWSSAVVAAALNTGGMGLELLIGRTIPGMPRWPPVASALVGLVLVGWLSARRRRASAAFCSVCFVVNTLSIAAALWLTNPTYAAHPRDWWPFQGSKLGCMAVALLAPELYAGLISVAIYAGGALAQYWTFPPGIRGALAVGEPWATIAFAVFGAILLVQRRHHLTLELGIERARAEARSYERQARAFMAVRDLANTPLQTIRLCAAVIERRAPELRDLIRRIDGAVLKLRAMNEILDEHDAARESGAPQPTDASLDSLALLRDARPPHPPHPGQGM
jgi:hypothetical protein